MRYSKFYVILFFGGIIGMIEEGAKVVLIKNGIKGTVTEKEKTESKDPFTQHPEVNSFTVKDKDGKEYVCLERDLQIEVPEDQKK